MTISYDLPIKDYIARLNKTGHVTHSKHRKTSVTIHHNASTLTHDQILNVWKNRPASAHFDVDANGDVAQFVEANEYAWATGSTVGNQTSISIEMCNSSGGPAWRVSEVTLESTARLAAWLFLHIINEKPSRANLLRHSHWYGTACPGPYVDAQWTTFLVRVQALYIALDAKHTVVTTGSLLNTKSFQNQVASVQGLLECTADGVFGPVTKKRLEVMLRASFAKCGYPVNQGTISEVKLVQTIIDTVPDGVWGPKSQAALRVWVAQLQRVLGVAQDGLYGPSTGVAVHRFVDKATQNV